MPTTLLSREAYTVGWIIILAVEFAAARAMLDEEHRRPDIPLDDPYLYATGNVNGHNVVITCSGEAGISPASHCATQLMRSFPGVKIGLLSGIGGGVPTAKHDIRLGDVVVSKPDHGYGGVAWYDAGRLGDDGLQPTGHLDRPPLVLRNAAVWLEASLQLGDSQFYDYLADVRPAELISTEGLFDELYDANDITKKIIREPRGTTLRPVIHHGLIASGSWVIKTSGSKREDLLRRVRGDVLCFDMEAAGLMNTFPCLVVRGISDYCDSHKNDGWHKYASTTAACYCKLLLKVVTQIGLESTALAVNVTNQVEKDVQDDQQESKQQKLECLKSLSFAEIGSRKSNIDEPNPETCEWIFDDSHYKAWNTQTYDPRSRNVLWIKGKPGSGKSTLMKRLTRGFDRKSSTGDLFCFSYFFNARGARLENSILGLYRTLVFQILQASTASMEDFLPRFLQKEKDCPGERVTWQTPELSEFFCSAISEVKSRPTYIFIDALDECDQEDVRQIVKKFELCSVAALSNGAMLKICLASRHYPHISLRTVTGHEIFMEDHNMVDIRRYVNQELHLPDQDVCAELRSTVVEKSSGIFMWTLFMVRRLLRAFDQGLSATQMRVLLSSVPPSLEGLFEETITSMEPDRQASISLLAPWVICALRPLKLYELHAALVFSTDQPPSSLQDPKIQKQFDAERVRKHLIDSSGGLFETIKLNDELFVQVIHESVREVFLGSKEIARIMKLPEGKSFHEYAHGQILTSSANYFHVKEIRNVLPQSLMEGSSPIVDLAAWLCKPIRVPFEIFAHHGVTYFHDFIFVHMKKAILAGGETFQYRKGPITKWLRTVLGGWLALLYHFILQTGRLSSFHIETLYLLRRNNWMIGWDFREFFRIANCINNLVIFVNKAMKDGFVLDTALAHRPSEPHFNSTSHLYLRLFKDTPINVASWGVRAAFRHPVFPQWVHYDGDIRVEEVLSPGFKLDNSFVLGFVLEASSSACEGLEDFWSRGAFPTYTVPLRDWQILERLEGGHGQIGSLQLNSTYLRWSSMTLRRLPPISYRDIIERCRSPYDPSLWPITDRPFKVLAVRADRDLQAYSLWKIKTAATEEGAI